MAQKRRKPVACDDRLRETFRLAASVPEHSTLVLSAQRLNWLRRHYPLDAQRAALVVSLLFQEGAR